MKKSLLTLAVLGTFAALAFPPISAVQAQITIGPGGVQLGVPLPDNGRAQPVRRDCSFYYQMNRQRYTVCAEFSDGRWHRFRDANGNRLPQGAEVYDSGRTRHHWD